MIECGWKREKRAARKDDRISTPLACTGPARRVSRWMSTTWPSPSRVVAVMRDGAPKVSSPAS